jgi:hypothetical protein
MRTVIMDEVYGLNGEPLDSLVDFKCYVPEKYKALMEVIHHVDTRLRLREDGTKYWRVQGYIELDDLECYLDYLPESPGPLQIKQDVYLGFSKGKVEIWSMSVPYMSNFNTQQTL